MTFWRRKRPPTTTTTTPPPSTSVVTVPPSTTTVVTPPPPIVVPKLRGEMLGISAGSYASTAVLDACIDLGVKWVRISIECGWANALANVADTVKRAHDRGLRVIQVVQAGNQHRYDDPAMNTALVKFAQDCALAGCDVIEVGNEWNHQPFWTAPLYSVMPPLAQARLSIDIARGVRAVSTTIPVITNGLSPEANAQNPYLWLPPFWNAYLAEHRTVGWSGIGLHPYCYPELATTNPVQWNPLRQVPTILADANALGLALPVWLTEFGAPGFATGAPTVRGVVLTEAQQAINFRAYIDGIKALEATGIRFPVACIATMFDGQSQTTAVEGGLGLRRADGTRKEAWAVVRQWALEPLPA